MTSNGRVARLTALALATGTLVAAGASSAGAASTSTDTFTTAGGGSVIHLEVNLPVAVPGVPQHLVQDIVMTGTSSRSGLQPAAIANAFLGQATNNIPVVSDALNMSKTAQYGKTPTASQNYLPGALSQLGVSGELLALNTIANNPNVNGVVTSSHSSIANLDVAGPTGLDLTTILNALSGQLTGLLANIPVPVQTTDATGAVTTVNETVTAAVTSLVNQLTDALDAASQNQTKPVSDAAKTALAQLSSVLDSLPTTLTDALKVKAADGSLLHVGLIQSDQNVTRNAGVVTNTTHNLLTGINVLGGLVTVKGLESTASAKLGHGVSVATPKTTEASKLLSVNAAGLISVDVTDKLHAVLTADPALKPVTDQVNAALAQITDLVSSVLGANLSFGKVLENTETADKAAADVSAATLTIDPTNPVTGARLLPGEGPLVRIDFVPAKASVVKSESVVPSTPITPASTTTPAKALATTGAELPMTGALAVALLGLGFVARRRRMAHFAE